MGTEFLNGVLFGGANVIFVIAVYWTGFRNGYQHARRLHNLGVKLDDYEPEPIAFKRRTEVAQ